MAPKDIEIRELREIDVQQVYEVALEAWRYTYREIYSADFIQTFVDKNYAPAASLGLLPRVQAGQHFFRVALAGTGVVGFCHIAETQRGMELLRIYLRPAYIGKGVGRALLSQGEEFVMSQGHNRYFCFVHRDNELGKSFYLRNGFVHIAGYDDPENWCMEKTVGARRPQR